MYNYETQKKDLFTDEGQRQFLSIRDKANTLLNSAGCFMAQNVLEGDAWTSLACIDRLVELNEIREVKNTFGSAGQHRIFIRR